MWGIRASQPHHLAPLCSFSAIPPSSISLRHLAAELFHAASGDVSETRSFLDHANLNTTQVYLGQLGGDEHRHWQEMARKLGVG